MSLPKKELIVHLRCAEHNQEVAEQALEQQAKNVKDWVPVVRCKDCKYFNTEERCDFENTNLYSMEPDFFCDYGERKDTACDACDLTRWTE